MNTKKIICLITTVLSVAAVAAAVALLVDKLIKKKNDCLEAYIESDCTPDDPEITE